MTTFKPQRTSAWSTSLVTTAATSDLGDVLAEDAGMSEALSLGVAVADAEPWSQEVALDDFAPKKFVIADGFGLESESCWWSLLFT